MFPLQETHLSYDPKYSQFGKYQSHYKHCSRETEPMTGVDFVPGKILLNLELWKMGVGRGGADGTLGTSSGCE
jgi:hypothetical protein